MNLESKLDLLAELLYHLHKLHISEVERYGKFKVSDTTWFQVRDTPWNYLEIEVYTEKKRHTISFDAYDYNLSQLNGWRVQSLSAPQVISFGEIEVDGVRYEHLSPSIIRQYIENIPTVAFVDAFIKGLKILLAYTD
jgi:hypothetical protein